MSVLPEVAALLAWLLLCALTCGSAAVCWLGVAPGTRVERLMVVAATGVTLLGATVFLLLLFGVYQRASSVALPVACGLYLATLALRRDPRLLRLLAPTPRAEKAAPLADRVAIGACAALLVLAGVDALTSPHTGWDAVIQWDKWAADWGRRTHLSNYAYAFPQMLPMFTSLAYKLAGQGGAILPPATFAVHALHPFLGLLLLLALVRLAAAFRVACWPLLLVVFGSRTVRQSLSIGGVDVLVTALTAAAAAWTVALLAAPERATRAAGWLAALLLAGAFATKPTGLFATVASLATLLAWKRWPPEGTRASPFSRADGLRLALVPPLLAAPLYGWALYADLTYRLDRLDPRELHYFFARMGSILRSAADVARPRAGDSAQVALETLDRAVADYGVPRASLGVLLAGALIVLVCAAGERRARGLVAPALAYLALWMATFSYDVRNLMPALPFFGVVLACGLERARAAARRPALGRVIGVSMALVAALPAWAALGEAGRTLAGLVSGPRALPTRLRAIESGVDAKVATFFPDEWDDYAFIKSTGLDRGARYVIAAGPLYRLFSGGAYPISVFWWGHAKPGDLYVSYVKLDRGPLHVQDWFLVRATPYRRTYVHGPHARSVPLDALSLEGPRPPLVRAKSPGRLVVRYSGVQGLVGHDVLADRPAPGSSVLWQLVVEGRWPDPRLRPAVRADDPALIDAPRTSLSVERLPDGRVAYAGLVTLSRRPVSGKRLLVGAVSDEAGPHLRVRAFRVWIRPALAPPG